jgi:hypothetical protein
MHDQNPKTADLIPAKKSRQTPEVEGPQSDARPWIPESKLPPIHPDSINSIVRNILLRSPFFPKFYADMLLLARPNSPAAKLLRPRYLKILSRINEMQRTKTCTHIKVTGVRCGSPALRAQAFCYFHQRMHRGVRTPPEARLHPIALLEDGESIQTALMEVINGLMRNSLDFKRATLILRALHIAVKNANRVRFDARKSDMVKELPHYQESALTRAETGIGDLEIPFEAAYGPDPRASKVYRNPKTAEQVARERAETIANYYGYPTAEAYEAAKKAKEEKYENAARQNVTREDVARACPERESKAPSPAQPTTRPNPESATARVAADALVRPSGPQVRCATPRNTANSAQDATPRKPPTTARHGNGVTTGSAPKERKIAAHSTSCG